MKLNRLVNIALGAAVLFGFATTACEEEGIYTVDAPDWRESKIDSIAAAEAAKNSGDTTKVTIGVSEVGTSDCTAAWWSAFSDYFTITAGKQLVLEFENHTSGGGNWNNWNVCLADGQRDGDGYAEHFVLRSDAYGWGNASYDASKITFDYQDIDGDGDCWNDFLSRMEGAKVKMKLDLSTDGWLYLTAEQTATDGTVMIETYQQLVEKSTINAFLIADASYLKMEKAYLVPTEHAPKPDGIPLSIELANYPRAVVLGDENFIGNLAITAKYSDGTSAVIDTSMVVMSTPDMTTLGEKTVTIAYSGTSQGNFSNPVFATYSFNIVAFNKVVIDPITLYYDANTDGNYVVSPLALKAKGVDEQNAETPFTSDLLAQIVLAKTEFEKIPGTTTIEGDWNGIATSVEVTFAPATYLGTDVSTGWWTVFTPDVQIAANDSVVTSFYVHSSGLENWHSSAYILRGAALNEYAVCRNDNYGWGAGYENNADLVLESNWNWDIFKSDINGAFYTVKVVNNGNDTADIYITVQPANGGDMKFQNYKGIKVTSSDLFFSMTCEGSYVVIPQ